jgi:hypothetical protein
MEELDNDTLDTLERRLEELRNQYEQFFLGSKRTPPEQQRTSVQYLIRRLANQQNPNYQIRFRFQQLVAKFNSYNQYWERIMHQIETGTYKRDVFKAALHSGQNPLEATKKGTAKKAPAKKEKDTGGMTEEKMDKLHSELVQARKSLNQSVEGLSKDKLQATIKKQLPELQKKHKGKKVDFKVVVEDGKAKLKATVK